MLQLRYMARNIENQRRWAREYYHKRKIDQKYRAMKRMSAQKYYQANKEKCLEWRKKYWERNKEKYRKYRREYRHNNPIGIYSVIKDGVMRNGCKRKDLLKISKEDFVRWYNQAEKICFYCKRTLDEIGKEGDRLNRKVNRLTIDRTDNLRGYELGNIVLCCMRCNAIKSDYFTKEEMLKIGKIIYDKNS